MRSGRHTLYRSLHRYLSWWPFSLLPPRWPPPRRGAKVAYYHHAFPILTETFIQREVTALRNAGIDLTVFSHAAEADGLFESRARELMQSTTYLPAMRSYGLAPGFWRIAQRHPLRLANSFLWIVLRQHTRRKALWRDRQLFNRAVYLADVLRREGITHVHSPWASPDATIALLAARLAGVRYSVQARASDIHLDLAAFGRVERLAPAAFIVTNSRYNEAKLRAWLPPSAPIHVIRNGIELERFRPAMTPRPRRETAQILCVARISRPKGLEYLLHACRRLADQGREFRCEIVGGRVGSEVNYYLEIAKLRRRLGLEGVVELVGARPFDEVLAKYAEADVFVLPLVHSPDGRRDITPNVLIEALAMQLPVVSTPTGGVAEIVADGVSGLLVPERDEPALAGAIGRILDDPELARRMGENGRRHVEQCFDIRRNITAYVDLFGGV